jgi:predicted AlkP superfamily pyrophosphatase or phosphodiesterase
MIHHNILEEIKKDRQHGSFIYPYYGKYSIAEIPPTVLSFFNIQTDRATLSSEWITNTQQKFKKLLYFFVDGFAYDHFVAYEKELPFFSTLKDKGNVYPLTSVFPSTTSAALTALHTNLTPQEHGLPEWTVFFEELDRISFGSLRETEGTPDMLFQGKTLYRTLREHGVTPYVFTYESYFPSAYSSVTQEGAVTVTFKDGNDLFPKLLKVLEEEKGPAYIFVYWGEIDGIEHLYGPKSPEHIQGLQKLGTLLQNEFIKKLQPEVAEDTFFILSSDHGQINIRNEDIIYLNTYIDLEASYFKTASQKTVYPTGAPHNVFLHIDKEKIQTMIQYLRHNLEGKADVLSTEEALARGLFGLNEPSERFIRRIGDILILPYEGYHVWYQFTPDFYWRQLGIHGGLSRDEMLVPFIVSPLKQLL